MNESNKIFDNNTTQLCCSIANFKLYDYCSFVKLNVQCAIYLVSTSNFRIDEVWKVLHRCYGGYRVYPL